MMGNSFSNSWETYVQSWKVTNSAEKQQLFNASLAPSCTYRDPLAIVSGHNELQAYMHDFHQQFPGLHFVTTRFRAHHNRSIAEWELRNGDNIALSTGISFGEYGEDGKLIGTKFAHRGDPLLLNETVNYVYGSWLMQSQARHTYGPDLEIYGAEYMLGSAQSVIHYAIPINDSVQRA